MHSMGQLALDGDCAIWHFLHMENFTDILNDVEAFAADRGVSPATVCRNATGNPRLYERMKRREETLRADFARLREYMNSTQPDTEAV